MSQISESISTYQRAVELMPGGVSSPVRAFKGVGGTPLFIDRAEGAYLIDIDGNRYIDYVMSWGPMILGHAHPAVVQALNQAVLKGTSYGAPSPLEVELAELVVEFVPTIDMVRFVNSGTEATMSVLRLARAFTGRDKILKFKGNYHGHADMLLVQAGSGVATLGLPDSPGVTQATVADTLTAPYNDIEAVNSIFEAHGEEIAAVIVEPVSGNMGLIPPVDGFLEGLRAVTQAYGSLLIFDEVMTGFRVHPGGAQTLFGIEPDLTALGKVIGGGLPVGAYGGRRDIMEMVAPVGPMYQAGTLSGNPLAMTAGIETLRALRSEALWVDLNLAGEDLIQGLRDVAAKVGIPMQFSRVGTMIGLFFSETPVIDWETSAASNGERFKIFFHKMLERGVYMAPSKYEGGFTSIAHGRKEITHTLEAAEIAFRAALEAG